MVAQIGLQDFSQHPIEVQQTRTGSNTDSKSINQMAQKFESLLISMLVKEMRQSSGFGEGMFPGDSSDSFGAIFDMHLSDHLAQNGGLGLGHSIQLALGDR